MRLYEHPELMQLYRRSWKVKKVWLTRRGSFRKLARYTAALTVVVGLAVLNIALLQRAQASAPYQADDVLGQVNSSGNPVFDQGIITRSTISGPWTTTVDSVNHRLFVADTGDNRILVYSLNNQDQPTGKFPDFVIGHSNFTDGSPVNSPASASGLNSPEALAYDSVNQRLFVTDTGNSRVLVFDLSGGIANGMSAIRVLGQSNFTNDGCNTGGISAARLCTAKGLVYDSAGNRLFVTDQNNNRVLVFDLSGGITNGMSAIRVLGQTDFVSSGGSVSVSKFANPEDVTYDPTGQRLFVSDFSNYRVMVFNIAGGITNGMNASNVIGQVDFNSNPSGCSSFTDSNICNAIGVVYDPGAHNLFVSNYNRILVFNITGGITNGMSASKVLGQTTFTTNDPSASNNDAVHFTSVTKSFFNSANSHLYVPNITGRVLIYDLSSGITNGQSAGYILSNLDATVLTGGPQGSVLDSVHHRLFISDSQNSRVLVYNLDSNNNLVDHTADSVLGQTLFDSDAANINQSGLNNPKGLAYDAVNNRLFVTDSYNNRVLVFNLSGGISNGMNAAYVLGELDFVSSSCALGQSSLCFPASVAYDSTTNYLYIGDSGNGRVMIFNVSPGTIASGEDADHVLGEPDFSTDSLGTPTNSVSGGGGLVLDQTNHRLFGTNGIRVMVFDISTLSDGKDADHELGETDYISNDSAVSNSGPADAKSFYPAGLTYDAKHQALFIQDNYFYRVLMFNVKPSAITDGEAASAVLGQPDMTTPASGPTFCIAWSNSTICNPLGTTEAYDASNNRLYVSDYASKRQLAFNFARLASSAPGGTTGSAYNFSSGAYAQGTPTYSLSSGSLPAGLSLNTSSGVISGTPTTPGLFNFTVDLADDNGSAGTFSDRQSYSITIPDTVPPSVPTGLHVTDTTKSTISLAWNASIDNVGVVGYRIYRDGGGTPIASTAGTSFTDSGLSSGTTHTYTVTAYDAAGNESGHSGSVSGITRKGGGNGGGNGGGDSSNSSSPANPISTPLDLDNLPGFSDGSGFTTDVSAGQVLNFTDTSNGSHSITVLQIDSGGVQLKLDNTDLSLKPGGQTSRDVNNDGHDDIGINLNSVNGGKANMTFKKIIFAIAPGGQTSSGFGAGSGSTTSQPKAGPGFLSGLLHRIPKIVLLVFPWLLFILLGSSVVRMVYLSVQERRTAERIAKQLDIEKALSDEKRNFVTLSSHYLRTPMAAITNGIDLLAALGGGTPVEAELKELGQKLNISVNDLLSKAAARAPSEVQAAAPGVISPLGAAKSMAAGFIQISSLQVMFFALTASFVLVGLADYILKHVDLYNVGLVNYLTQLAGLILVAVLFYASLRSYHKRKQLREQAEVLLNQQRELDTGRNLLVRNSLTVLKDPLAQLKAKLQANLPANPQMAKPALDGITQLEGLINKFTILAALETGAMGKVRTPLELSQLVGQISGRYSSVLQAKGLDLKAKVPAAQLNQDPLLLSFVIDSLLSNAIKYSPQGGQIELSSRRSHGGIQIYVRDSGPGIEEAKQAQLFQPFSRAENAAEDFNRQGAGLSLYLDKLVMQYLGGRIDIDSRPGAGTTMSFSLPA